VHRLDQSTSGLVLFPASRTSLQHVMALFRSGRVRKRYDAVLDTRATPAASPLLHADEGVVDAPLGRRAGVPLLHTAAAESGGRATALRPARTRWRVLARGPTAVRVSLEPETGKTHQLRIHTAVCLGAPILNDALYGVVAYGKSFWEQSLARGALGAEAARAIEEGERRAAAVADAAPPALARGAPPLPSTRLLLHASEIALPDDAGGGSRRSGAAGDAWARGAHLAGLRDASTPAHGLRDASHDLIWRDKFDADDDFCVTEEWHGSIRAIRFALAPPF
jgi:23S rRNA-/tRNA-specific pseudouridylate synthase